MKVTNRAMMGLRGMLDDDALVVADRFEIHERLGEGGMATVHAALDRETGTRVAVKLLRGSADHDLVRFEREIDALRTIDHPAVVKIVAHGLHEGTLYLVMDLLEGRTLLERFRRGRLSVREALALGKRLAEGLLAIHGAGFEHRDLTPSNVFLVAKDDEGTVANAVLLDFGLSRHTDAKVVTARGAVVGTPGYLAPERVREGTSGPQADVFSLGCIVYEALLGAPPFASDTTYGELSRVLLEVAPLVREERPDAPPGLETSVARMLAKDPAARPSAKELVATFDTLLHDVCVGDAAGPVELCPGLSEGDLIGGKYRLERRIGEGGMGVVLAARHVDLGTRVALKVLREGDTEERRFLREAQAMARLEGQNVARVLDVGRTSDGPRGRPFIVMEHLRGKDLAKHLAEHGPFSIESAVDHVLEACAAIAEAHALGIVHRDLKPSNLFLVERRDGAQEVKVLDFGISKLTRPLDGAQLTGTSTAASVVLGSVAYMSPEQLESSANVTERSDLWALGVVLFELVSGVRPFDGESSVAIAARIAASPPRPLGEVRSDVPKGLRAALDRSLEKDPAARYADVAAFAAAMVPFAGTRGNAAFLRVGRLFPSVAAVATTSPLAAQSAGRNASPPSRAMWPWAMLAGLATAAVLGWQLTRESKLASPPVPEPKPSTQALVTAVEAPSLPVAAASSVAPTASIPPKTAPEASGHKALPRVASTASHASRVPAPPAKKPDIDLRDPALERP